MTTNTAQATVTSGTAGTSGTHATSSVGASNARHNAPIWAPPLPHTSRIKWFDPVRRFGFVQPHDGGGDIWFNWLTLLRNKIPEHAVEPDMPVRFSYAIPDNPSKQRSVIYMRLGATD